MKFFYLFLALLIIVQKNYASSDENSNNSSENEDNDSGSEESRKKSVKPLFLTPLIKQNKLKEAQSSAEVKLNQFKDIKSYSGYLTVNKQYNSNLFFWFFPSKSNYKEDPVILWLQGGPGASSMIGLFKEHGPFELRNSKSIKLRKSSWINKHSVIYMDNPVGAGFSFTEDEEGFARNFTQVGDGLYEALQQFFTLFPDLKENDFYVAGESMAGKYVPTISHIIHKKNPDADLKINLKGLVIGNGFIDPINQIGYSDYLYESGLIDFNGKELFETKQKEIIQHIEDNEFEQAADVFNNLIDGNPNHTDTIFTKLTGFKSHFHLLRPVDLKSKKTNVFLNNFLDSSKVREAIHIGNRVFNKNNSTVKAHLKNQSMKSVAPLLEELLDNYKVLIFSGQLDIILPYPITVDVIKKLKFQGAEEYKTASRTIWKVGDEIAGYVKKAGYLTEALVRNAGHMASGDQQKWVMDLIDKFTGNESFV